MRYGLPDMRLPSALSPLAGGMQLIYLTSYLIEQSYVSSVFTFWQYASSGTNPGDQDLFNGDAAALKRYQALLVIQEFVSLTFFV
jgi:hypothetical protein